jgi:hypothetical protein
MSNNKTERLYILAEYRTYSKTIKDLVYSIECCEGFERVRMRRLLRKYLEYISYKEGLD